MIWISDLRDASQRNSKIRSFGEVFTKNAISAIKNTFLLFDVSYSLIFSGEYQESAKQRAKTRKSMKSA